MIYYGIKATPLPPVPSLEEQIRNIVREEIAAVQKEQVVTSGTIIADAITINGEKATLGERPEVISPLKCLEKSINGEMLAKLLGEHFKNQSLARGDYPDAFRARE